MTMIGQGYSTVSWEAFLTSPEAVELRADEARGICELMKSGRTLRDGQFDQIYPSELRNLSKIHWTPVAVAKRAAELLVKNGGTRVLDVGSGIGKFCLIGALTTPAEFVGIEQRGYFAQYANHLVERQDIPRVRFIHGNMADLDWSPFDAVYLFNPFYENIVDPIRIDRFVSISQERYSRYVEVTKTKLKTMPLGTRVVTYHGFGGEIPPEYSPILQEPCGTGLIELWKKER